ncbi:MAG: aldo/keto reductase [Armatimonadota bacterium]
MKYRPLGNSDIAASVVAFGAWAIGGWPWGGTDEQNAIDAIDTALEIGMNFIDTAPVYGLGLSEEIIGKALKGKRDKAVIATKCGLIWHEPKGTYFFEEYGKKVYKYLGPESIRYEVEQSLKRMQTDYIDLLQTHWQENSVPIEDTMKELVKLKEEGKIRAIGVCNVKKEQLEEYMKYGIVDTDQELYSMLYRDIEKTNAPFCKEEDIAILAYSPIAQGLLTGKIKPGREFKDGDLRKNNPKFSGENLERVTKLLDKIQPIADKYNATLAQTVIAWTISQPGITHALVGARNPEQVRENAGACDFELTQQDINTITDAVNQL